MGWGGWGDGGGVGVGVGQRRCRRVESVHSRRRIAVDDAHHASLAWRRVEPARCLSTRAESGIARAWCHAVFVHRGRAVCVRHASLA